MSKYRKKPVIIDAWNWKFSPTQNVENGTPEWIEVALKLWPAPNSILFQPNVPHICVNTIKGVVVMKPGDWIIRNVKNELYPCKADIFEATYEEVE